MRIAIHAVEASGISVTAAAIRRQNRLRCLKSPVRQLPASLTLTADVTPGISWCPAIMLTARQRHSVQALCAVPRTR